ncbi:DMT family transporter [Nocardioidaceae bacterium SCSIO 66511]|nr:DMT family transporter [Nocardioidaceae bacterium SCSIO 66511]
MAVVLALFAAGAYGLSDFLGGLFSRRASPWPVAVAGQASAAVCVGCLAAVIGGTVTTGDWAWGAAAGFGNGIGAAFLYRGLSRGRMSVVAPISALGAALVPVAVGLLTGERPSLLAWVGIVAAMPAIYLISQVRESADTTSRDSGLLDGIVAGLGFGALFAMLGQIDEDAGLYPLALSQLASVVAVVVTALAFREAWVPRDRAELRGLIMGPLLMLALGSFVYATHIGLLTLVAVITTLYPAMTVALAAVVLRERIHRVQAIGLIFAAVAVSLVAAG